MKKLLVLFFVIIPFFCLTACNGNLTKGGIVSQTDNGMAQLDIMPQKLFEYANIGDMVVVTVGDFKAEMPLVDEAIAEEGKLQLFYDSNEHSLSICAYNQNFCKTYNVSPDAKVKITKK
ncbi:MAG: hypothetical protein E7480_01720 [Ruminococcaceae bacterium]|nr:hypothetical protein [Oscillospiraceae bacterium]